jgi:GntR family transcriptional regulator / MocR family aminotransferase
LYEQIRDEIAAGRLRPGDRLPPSRHVAQQLGLSRHTVTTAYGRLAAEGFTQGRAGGGTVVAHVPASVPRPARPAAITPTHRFAGWIPEPGPFAGGRGRFDLRAGIPDPALFPLQAWRRRLTLATTAVASSAAPGDPAGEIDLRRAIARWTSRSRSVIADETMVIVTSGAQHAIDLVAQMLLEPGDTVVTEDPGYAPVISLLEARGANVVSAPVDHEGIVVGQLPATAKIVYVTPSHQYPLGAVLSMRRRRELLDWAGRAGAAVIEDDYDSEFRYVDRPLEPIQRLDSGRVIYIGSFSKTLSPALRLGFAIVPPTLASPIAALRQLIDWHPPIAAQLALASFIDDGLLDKHLRRTGRIYSHRHQILQSSLAGPLSPYLAPLASSVGLHITALLRNGRAEDEVRAKAAEHGIATTGLSACYRAGPAQPGLVIGFGAADTPTLAAAAHQLRRVLDSRP